MTAEPIHVFPPTIDVDGRRAVWTARIEHPAMPESLWFSLPAQFAGMVSERLDAALLALTIPALRLQAPLHLHGTVTDELFHQHTELQHLFNLAGHGRRPVELHAAELSPVTERAPGVATGFSAGVDSFAVLAQEFYGRATPASRRVTHLLFNNVGSHYGSAAQSAGAPSSAEALPGQRALWSARLGQAKQVADKIGLPIVDVDSNVPQISVCRSGFLESHTPRNAAVAHLLSGGIGMWYYASGSTYPHVRAGDVSGRGLARMDPLILPLMSTSSLSARASGTHLRRVDKTALIADLPHAQEHLDVCVAADDGTNCSSCAKCLRTLAALDFLGKLDLFSTRFDTRRWSAHRDGYLEGVVASRGHDAFSRELVDFAGEQGVRLPAALSRGVFKARARTVKPRLKTVAKRALLQ